MNICLWNAYHFATHLQNSAFFEKGHHGGVKKRYFFKKQGFYFKNIEKNIFVNILCCTFLERCKTRLLASYTEKTIGS